MILLDIIVDYPRRAPKRFPKQVPDTIQQTPDTIQQVPDTISQVPDTVVQTGHLTSNLGVGGNGTQLADIAPDPGILGKVIGEGALSSFWTVVIVVAALGLCIYFAMKYRRSIKQ